MRMKTVNCAHTFHISSIHDYRDLGTYLDTIGLFIHLSVMRRETPVSLFTGVNTRTWLIQMHMFEMITSVCSWISLAVTALLTRKRRNMHHNKGGSYYLCLFLYSVQSSDCYLTLVKFVQFISSGRFPEHRDFFLIHYWSKRSPFK